MAIPYHTWGYKRLKDEVKARGIEIPTDADGRSKEGLRKTLMRHDKQIAEAEAKANDVSEPKPVEEMSFIERKLAEKIPHPTGPMFVRDVGGNRNQVEAQLRPQNLPADYAYGWASLTAAGGEDVGRWTSKGWIRATEDMMTTDPNDTDKIYLPNWEVHTGGYVRVNDVLLVIANRRVVEARKRASREKWNSTVQKEYGERGSGAKGSVSDPSQSSGHRFRKSAQWAQEEKSARSDEMLAGEGA